MNKLLILCLGLTALWCVAEAGKNKGHGHSEHGIAMLLAAGILAKLLRHHKHEEHHHHIPVHHEHHGHHHHGSGSARYVVHQAAPPMNHLYGGIAGAHSQPYHFMYAPPPPFLPLPHQG